MKAALVLTCFDINSINGFIVKAIEEYHLCFQYSKQKRMFIGHFVFSA